MPNQQKFQGTVHDGACMYKEVQKMSVPAQMTHLWSTWRARALTRSASANQKTCRNLKSSLAARVFAYDWYGISLDDDPLRLNGSELLGAVSNTWGRLRCSPPQLFTSLIVSVWVGLAGGQLHMLRQRGSRIAGKRASCESSLALSHYCACVQRYRIEYTV